LKYWLPFGAVPSKANQREYLMKSSNFKNGKFYNEHNYQRIYKHYEKNQYMSTKNIRPIDKMPMKEINIPAISSIHSLSVTWFGHSSLLLQMHGMNILIDPVFSSHASPFSFFGAAKFNSINVPVNKLPNIDILVITHDHFDHLDYQTIKQLNHKVKTYIVPLGVECHLKRWGINQDKIISLAWWQSVDIQGLQITCTPARHNSSRNFLLDSYKTLWASFVFIDDKYKVFESGDTGFDSHFQAIHEKFGTFDLAILECGQYNTRWISTHMTPKESVKAGQILNAGVVLPIHWGAFSLAQHPWDDSIERFVFNAKKENISYTTPMIGETIDYEKYLPTLSWWKDIQ